ncbi:MAG: lipopolysaccharide kinase InaA family protein [Porphyromonadaceae bacterium]|nr:lipopolysaccharide kinase InaA family protein [Porphyromonadaceae bacterium]
MDDRVIYRAIDEVSQQCLSKLIEIAESFRSGKPLPDGWKCRPIYEGRNTLYRLEYASEPAYVLKCFGRLSLLRRIYYSYLGTSKAKRSYLNALQLDFLLGATAPALGYAEQRDAIGLLGRSYYASAWVDATEFDIHPHMRGLTAPSGFAQALARFIANVHIAGVVHRDLSPGNVLYQRDDRGEYHFYLVDVNRMAFRSRPLTLSESAKNLSRLASKRSVLIALATAYARERGWEQQHTLEALTRRYERFWLRRLPKMAARYARRVYGLSLMDFIGQYIRYLSQRTGARLLPRGNRQREILEQRAERFYLEYLSYEDISHTLRLRRGYSYELRRPHQSQPTQ